MHGIHVLAQITSRRKNISGEFFLINCSIANSALAKIGLHELRNNRWLAHTGVGPTSSKQVLMTHLLNAPMRWIYPRRCSQVRSAKGLALAGFGTPVELDPFSETNYVTLPSTGW